MDTKPTIETILMAIQEFRAETATNFTRLEHRLAMVEEKMGVVNDELLTIKAEIRQLQRQNRELATAVESLLPTKML